MFSVSSAVITLNGKELKLVCKEEFRR
jgi:hypothetical protein